MLRTGPSMDCGADPIWADDNLRVEELGVYVGSDQSWSLLRFAHNGTFKQRWAETRFLEYVAGSGGCSGASPSNRFSSPLSKRLSHPEFEAKGWKVMLRTGPSMDCDADPIWADDNLQVMELGTFAASDQTWSLLQFNHNGATRQRWAETRFLEGAGGEGGCYGASPSTIFNSPHSRTLSHPEYEAKGWKVMLRTGPSMDCDADPIWADDNLQVMELGTFAASDQSWSLLQFNDNGATKKRWAETRFLEIAGGAGGCSGASPSTRYDSPRSRLLSHPEFETKGWKVMLRTGPSMDCGSDPIWADDNLPVEEIGVYAGEDQSWSLLRFYRNGGVMERWAETRFLDSTGSNDTPTPVKPPPGGMPVVIYDTDMGPDIDDALALAALHTYANKGMAHIAAVTLSRNSDMGARYIDLLNTFYARPDIPVGVYRGNTSTDNSENGYTRDIVNSGKYPYSLNTSTLPLGHLLMRDVLLSSPDNSVVIIQVGFSTNTARLLAEYPDLVARKVRLLSVMAGDFIINGGSNGSDNFSEFNVRIHPSSARLLFDRWPNEMVVSEFHLGNNILYPLSSIRNDFGYVRNHPIKDSYLNSTYDWHRANGDSYDIKSWDITSVIAAI
ncbi:MAG: nucleoside hydrolase, partial [Granulosicoccus sp.]